jgi:hypothetical protein
MLTPAYKRQISTMPNPTIPHVLTRACAGVQLGDHCAGHARQGQGILRHVTASIQALSCLPAQHALRDVGVARLLLRHFSRLYSLRHLLALWRRRSDEQRAPPLLC